MGVQNHATNLQESFILAYCGEACDRRRKPSRQVERKRVLRGVQQVIKGRGSHKVGRGLVCGGAGAFHLGRTPDERVGGAAEGSRQAGIQKSVDATGFSCACRPDN